MDNPLLGVAFAVIAAAVSANHYHHEVSTARKTVSFTITGSTQETDEPKKGSLVVARHSGVVLSGRTDPSQGRRDFRWMGRKPGCVRAGAYFVRT